MVRARPLMVRRGGGINVGSGGVLGLVGGWLGGFWRLSRLVAGFVRVFRVFGRGFFARFGWFFCRGIRRDSCFSRFLIRRFRLRCR